MNPRRRRIRRIARKLRKREAWLRDLARQTAREVLADVARGATVEVTAGDEPQSLAVLVRLPDTWGARARF